MDRAPDDVFWMREAIKEAEKALELDEVPVGAVLVSNNEIIGRGHNRVISDNDCSAHAEIQALRDAGKFRKNYRLINSRLYVTLEPCMMCAGSLIHARIDNLIFGAFDPKTGAVSSKDQVLEKEFHNHKVKVLGGVLESECSKLLKDFFKKKRQKAANKP